MSSEQSPKSILHELNLSKSDILALDPTLFTAEEKRAFIETLYGNPGEWSWKRELQSVAHNLNRWKLLLAEGTPSGLPYRKSHAALMYLANNRLRSAGGSNVTDFTDWIFRLYVPEKNYQSLLRGQRLERQIVIKRIPIPNHSRWKLIYDGMTSSQSAPLVISDLTINGIAMRGKPDLVFREKKKKRIVIVEIKASEADVPSDGWPNMRAQLWAYSKIDDWKDEDEIILVGEVWGFRAGLRLRKVIHWKKGGSDFQRENAELFACYRSHCEGV